MSAEAAHASPGLVEILRTQLPVLLVILPMISAPLCVLIRRARWAWGLALVVTWSGLWMAVQLLHRVLVSGTISYQLGGWPPPWGIELRIGLLGAFVLVIVSGISSTVLAAAPGSLPKEVPESRHYLFYACFLLCMTGLLGMTAAGDAFNVFVFLEISSLSGYTLIALGPTRRALIAAFRYLMMGTIGGTFILLGVGLLYQLTGTLNIADLGQRLALVEPGNRTVLVALACIVVGASIKLALLPLGIWLPNAYTFAPAEVTAFLAATSTKVAFFVLVRFIYEIFGAPLAFDRLHLDWILLPMALLAMFVGSTVAIFQRDVKRLLAYSSLAQVGYMVLGVALVTHEGLAGGIVHLFNHALTKSGLFLALAAVVLRLGSTRLDDLGGLGRRMPWTAAAFTLGGLSLIGVPLTAGFVSKWYLVRGALAADRFWIAAAILLSSLLALVYVWRVVEVLYFRPAKGLALEAREAPASILIPTWFLIAGVLFFGFRASFTGHLAEQAARLLIEGGG